MLPVFDTNGQRSVVRVDVNLCFMDLSVISCLGALCALAVILPTLTDVVSYKPDFLTSYNIPHLRCCMSSVNVH